MSARKGLTVKVPEEPVAANIVAQDLTTLAIDIAAATIGSISVDISAQTISTIAIDIMSCAIGSVDVNILSQGISTLAIDIMSCAIGSVDVNILSQGISTLAIDIMSCAIGSVDINIVGQTMGDVNVNLNAQAADIDINLNAQTANVDIDVVAQTLNKQDIDNRPALFMDRFPGTTIDSSKWTVVTAGQSVGTAVCDVFSVNVAAEMVTTTSWDNMTILTINGKFGNASCLFGFDDSAGNYIRYDDGSFRAVNVGTGTSESKTVTIDTTDYHFYAIKVGNDFAELEIDNVQIARLTVLPTAAMPVRIMSKINVHSILDSVQIHLLGQTALQEGKVKVGALAEELEVEKTSTESLDQGGQSLVFSDYIKGFVIQNLSDDFDIHFKPYNGGDWHTIPQGRGWAYVTTPNTMTVLISHNSVDSTQTVEVWGVR